MDRFVKKFIVIIGILIVLGVFLYTSGMVEIAAAAEPGSDYTKLNVEIYETINKQGNPITAVPQDDMMFTFHVAWIVTVTRTATGETLSQSSYTLGDFTATQQTPGYFYQVNGSPYTTTYDLCTKFPFTDICIPFTTINVVEEGYYLIVPDPVPYGYCPADPYQKRTKDTNPNNPDRTTTVNEKFYMGPYCGNVAPDVVREQNCRNESISHGAYCSCVGIPCIKIQ